MEVVDALQFGKVDSISQAFYREKKAQKRKKVDNSKLYYRKDSYSRPCFIN